MYRFALQSLFRATMVSTFLFSSLAWAGDGAAKEAMGPKSDMGELDKTMSEEALKVAKLHFSNGVELLQADPPQYQDAYYQFQLALEKSGGSWKVRGNLGYCALKLERDGEALGHYDAYLGEGGGDVDAVERTTIEKELLLLRGNLAQVIISSSDPKAQITIERAGTTAPAQSYELTDGQVSLGLRSGAFSIMARSSGETLTWTPVLTPGKELTHMFDFEAAAKAETAAVPVDAPSPEPESKPTSGMRLAGFATGGVGLLALGGGLVTGLMSQSQEKQAKEDCINLFCPTSADSKRKSAETMATTANVLFIAGGVLAGAGVTLVILGGSKSEAESKGAVLQLAPSLHAGGGGIFAKGSF